MIRDSWDLQPSPIQVYAILRMHVQRPNTVLLPPLAILGELLQKVAAQEAHYQTSTGKPDGCGKNRNREGGWGIGGVGRGGWRPGRYWSSVAVVPLVSYFLSQPCCAFLDPCGLEPATSLVQGWVDPVGWLWLTLGQRNKYSIAPRRSLEPKTRQ